MRHTLQWDLGKSTLKWVFDLAAAWLNGGAALLPSHHTAKRLSLNVLPKLGGDNM